MKARADLAAALGAAVAAAAGGAFALETVEPVAGGCIHEALRLSGTGPGARRDFFAKGGAADRAPMFAAEAEGLEALRAAGALAVPEVVARGADAERAWLVLEWLELAPLDAASAAALGGALAAQHRQPRARFGWERDNFIGATSQPNGWSDDWPGFWRER
ncbi:MAG TPA: fructosamine kinase family protein, partial [Myxococcota bacterium]|nr:fructosamine kinase family protein [Myxococcota bacterium]